MTNKKVFYGMKYVLREIIKGLNIAMIASIPIILLIIGSYLLEYVSKIYPIGTMLFMIITGGYSGITIIGFVFYSMSKMFLEIYREGINAYDRKVNNI